MWSIIVLLLMLSSAGLSSAGNAAAVGAFVGAFVFAALLSWGAGCTQAVASASIATGSMKARTCFVMIGRASKLLGSKFERA